MKLFVIYVDFSKAYDRVPRRALIEPLSRLGCGYLMVAAISCLYSDTKMVLGAAIITATKKLGYHHTGWQSKQVDGHASPKTRDFAYVEMSRQRNMSFAFAPAWPSPVPVLMR